MKLITRKITIILVALIAATVLTRCAGDHLQKGGFPLTSGEILEGGVPEGGIPEGGVSGLTDADTTEGALTDGSGTSSEDADKVGKDGDIVNECVWKKVSCPEMHKAKLLPLVPKEFNFLLTTSPKFFLTMPVASIFKNSNTVSGDVFLNYILPEAEGIAMGGTFGENDYGLVVMRGPFKQETTQQIVKWKTDDYDLNGTEPWAEEQYVLPEEITKIDATLVNPEDNPNACFRIVKMDSPDFDPSTMTEEQIEEHNKDKIQDVTCFVPSDEDDTVYSYILMGDAVGVDKSYKLFKKELGIESVLQNKSFMDAWNVAAGDACGIIQYTSSEQELAQFAKDPTSIVDPFLFFKKPIVSKYMWVGLDFELMAIKGQIIGDGKNLFNFCGDADPEILKTWDFFKFQVAMDAQGGDGDTDCDKCNCEHCCGGDEEGEGF